MPGACYFFGILSFFDGSDNGPRTNKPCRVVYLEGMRVETVYGCRRSPISLSMLLTTDVVRF